VYEYVHEYGFSLTFTRTLTPDLLPVDFFHSFWPIPATGVCQESDMFVFSGVEAVFKRLVASFGAIFVEPKKVLIVIDTKGAQALRAAGQPVVAGLVLRCGAP